MDPSPGDSRGDSRGGLPSGGAVALGLAAAWLLIVATGLVLRPLLPIDETRYASVAWEMWVRHDLLVPHLNGLPYSDKPPLMFWLVQLAWSVFGVREVAARLVPALFGLASLPLTAYLARRLWPDRPGIAREAPVVLLGSLLWTLFASAMMFDLMVAFFDLAALAAILAARDGRRWGRWGWPLAGLAMGLGILSKGPVALLVPLAVGLAAPWWTRGERRAARTRSGAGSVGPRAAAGAGGAHAEEQAGDRPSRDPYSRGGARGRAWISGYGGLALALALAAAVALAWALPAAAAGGPDYADAILLKQTEDRLVSSFAHQRPWWWYLPLLPVFLFPVAFWPPLWRAVFRARPSRLGDLDPLDRGTRFCLAWLVPVLIVLSLISGKQPHYLLPLFPAFALLAGRAADGAPPGRRLDLLPAAALALLVGTAVALAPSFAGRPGTPGWLGDVHRLPGALLAAGALLFLALPARLRRPLGLAVLSWMTVVALHAAFAPVAAREYDVGPTARYVHALERRGVSLAWVGKYHGQLHFEGRLRRPFHLVVTGQEDLWLAEHPEGRVIAHLRQETAADPSRFELVQPYRDDELVVMGRAGPPASRRSDIMRSP